MVGDTPRLHSVGDVVRPRSPRGLNACEFSSFASEGDGGKECGAGTGTASALARPSRQPRTPGWGLPILVPVKAPELLEAHRLDMIVGKRHVDGARQSEAQVKALQHRGARQ